MTLHPPRRPVELTRPIRGAILLVAFVAAVAGLRAAAPVLTPLAVALFVAGVSLPVVAGLRRWGVRPSLAIAATVLLDAAVVAALVWIVVVTVDEMRAAMPGYLAQLQAVERELRGWFAARGITLPAELYEPLLQPQRVLDLVTFAARNLTSWLSLVLLLLLYLVFILVEAVQLPAKVRRVLGPDAPAIAMSATVLQQVQRYLAVKTLVSLLTGLSIGMGAWLLGVDFAPFWGLLAFALNYIPTIGSIIAAVPAVTVALLQLGAERALLLAVVYLGANVLFGNITDPILVGRQLRLAPIVVLASLVFWGWVWGITGAFLAVPLTITLRVALQSSRRWGYLAALMGPIDDDTPAVAATAVSPPTQSGASTG